MENTMKDSSYDVVIIGSGLGGLACGAMLSKEGYHVCVLEQMDIFGGCLQSFHRKGRNIDTGIHYIGSMGEGQIMRQYLQYFGIFDALQYTALDDDFDVIKLGQQQQFVYRHGYEAFIDELSAHFPNERAGIEKYCKMIQQIGTSINVEAHKKGVFSTGEIDKLSYSTVDFIAECVTNPLLQQVLAGTNPLYGGTREAANLYHHAMINHSNIEGAYRFVGGTQQLADLLVAQIRKNGGTVRNYAKVTKINVNGASITNVLLENGETVEGKHYISNLHPINTFALLGETPRIKKGYKTRLSLLPNTYGLFSVYMVMKPNTFRYINKNLYLYEKEDVWNVTLNEKTLHPTSLLLSSQLGSTNAQYSDVVTLMSPIHSTVFQPFSESTLHNRSIEYHEIKQQITENIIAFASQFHPINKEDILSVYAATPLTYQHYTGTPQGSAYGILKGHHNTMATLIPSRTKIENLFLTGQNLNVHGALGVTLTAAKTCSELLGEEYLSKKIGNV